MPPEGTIIGIFFYSELQLTVEEKKNSGYSIYIIFVIHYISESEQTDFPVTGARKRLIPLTSANEQV